MFWTLLSPPLRGESVTRHVSGDSQRPFQGDRSPRVRGGRMNGDVWSWLESLKELGYNPSLDNAATLLLRLEMPQHSFPAVHVAGSNGKGTCGAILANAFTLSGKCTGLFTSPHLLSVNERIRIDVEKFVICTLVNEITFAPDGFHDDLPR